MNTLLDSAELWLRPMALLSWKGTLLTVVAALSLVLLRRHLSPAWRHGLWLLVVLRFVLPDLGTSSFSMNGSAADPVAVWEVSSVPPEEELAPVVAQEIAPEPGEVDAVLPVPFEATPPPWTLSQVLTLVWLMGAVTVLGVMGVLHVRLLLRVRRDAMAPSPAVEAIFREACRMAGVGRRPRLVITDAVRAPSLFGLLRPAILLPKAVAAQEDEAGLRLVLLHELAHLKRWDLASQVIASLAVVVHWFNPVVWWAGRRLRAEAEMAADAQALRRAGVVEAHRMGELLLGFANHAAAVWLVSFLTVSQMGISGKGNELRRRIEALMDLARGRHTRWFVGMGLFFLLGVAGLTSAPAAEDAGKKSTPTVAQDGGQRTVAGRVVDAEGKPVAEAICMLRVGDERDFEQRKTMSDAEGRFTFEAVPSAGPLRVWARHDRYQEMKQPIPEVTPEEMADLKFVLQPVTSWVTGTVTAKADGRPVKGATVYVQGEIRFPGASTSRIPAMSWMRLVTGKVTTDDAGRYRFSKQREEHTSLAIAVEAPGLMVTVARAAWPEGELTQDIVMEADPGISGKVVTTDGKPVSGASLYITDSYFSTNLSGLQPKEKDFHYAPGRGWWLGNPVTGEDGSFNGRTYRDPAAVEWRIIAFHQEQGIGVMRWTEWKNGGTVTLEKWRTVHGVLRDPDGKLVKGKEVRILQMQTSRTPTDARFSISHNVTCVTDDQGRYRLEGLLPRSDTVLVSVEGQVIGLPSGGWLPGTTLEHTLHLRQKDSADAVKEQRPVKGRIVRPTSPNPLPGHELHVTIGIVGNPGVFPIDELRDDGSFVSRSFAPGTYELRVWAAPRNRDLTFASSSGVAKRFVLKAATEGAGEAHPLDLGEIALKAADFDFKPRSAAPPSTPSSARVQKVDAEVADAASFESWVESSGGGAGKEQKLTAEGKIVATVATNSNRNFLLRATKKADGSRHFTTMQPGTKDEAGTFTNKLVFHPGVDVQGQLQDLPKTYLGGGWVVASVRVSAEVANDTVYQGGIPSAIWFAWAPVRKDGSFRFASLPRGSLQLAGFGEGWVTRNPQGYSAEVPANLVTSGPVVKLNVGTQATFQGKVRVLLPDGTPAVGASVSVSSVGAATLSRVMGRWSFAVESVDAKAYAQHRQTRMTGHSSITDDEGHAALSNLPEENVTCQVTWMDPKTKARHVEKVPLRFNVPVPEIKLQGQRP